jgi:outer membrane protein TolC
VDASVQQARQQVLQAERTADQSRRALLDLMGVAPDAFERLQYDLDAEVPFRSDDEVVDQATQTSLKMMGYKAQKQALEAGRDAAVLEMRPALNAVGRVSQAALFPNGDGLDDEFGYTVFGGVRYERTFGDAASQTQLRQAEIDLRRVDSEIARLKQQIRTSAGEHNAAILNAREQIGEARKMLEIAEQRLKTEERNFRIGRIPLRDLIEARNQVTQAGYMLAAARVSLQFAATERKLLDGSMTLPWRGEMLRRMKLDKSLGGGQ